MKYSPHPKPLSQKGRGALKSTSSVRELLYIGQPQGFYAVCYLSLVSPSTQIVVFGHRLGVIRSQIYRLFFSVIRCYSLRVPCPLITDRYWRR
ncbi:hypothetical protein B9S53_08875 [Arthrospira sp. O9.13F]|nr:hypothetical protein B9S53_08875 [Arthrospira sp. O9.13F]